MRVKLSKVIKDLNVGLQTIQDFFAKKKIELEVNPNTKIPEDILEILIKEFKPDMEQKLKSEYFTSARQKEKAKQTEQPKEQQEVKTETEIRKPKVVGKIDLESAGKPAPKKEEPAPKEEEPVAPVVEQPQPEQPKQEEEAPKQEQELQEQPEVIEAQPEEAQPASETNVEPLEETKEEPKEETSEGNEIFTTATPVLKTSINVVGKIDLSAINQSKRKKKKTKEERRQERLAKEKARQGEDGVKKKRRRIGKEKIDIEKAAQQIQNTPGANKNAKNKDNENSKKKEKKNKRPLRPQVNEEDVQRQVKETLARLTNKKQNMGAKWRREKREAVREEESKEAALQAAEKKILKLTEFVTANDLAMMMNVPINKVIGTCMSLGVMVSINQRLDAETPEDLQQRPPVVTVMGHVDHGKTSLLDYIRKSNVIAGEAGGITQHIGAYNVKLPNGRRITFLDTPGHEAFTAMRARGAKVTDIVIVIVAADDNVMPQTKEALNHATAAGVPIVFAINKIDKDGANPDKIKEELANLNYLVEDWGGKYQSQDISAKKGIGVEELMEKVLLEADMLDLKANPDRKATGSIIESSLDKGRGYIATVLVDNGTLRVGDIVLAGTHYGKVKAMFNERNQRIKEAGPSSPALILGLNGAPTAGDKFNVMDTDQEARQIANRREQLQREQMQRTQHRRTLEDIGRLRALGEFHELNIIVKGDVDGSIEALGDSLIKLSTPEVQVNVIHKAVGAISESDVTLAAASDAYIIGFQVRPSADAKRLAAQEGVDIRIYSIIYDAIEEIKSAMEGMLSPDIKEEVIGNAEIKEVYHISKVGTIAGAMVKDGKLKRGCKVRVIRDGIVRHTGTLASLKRFKDDAKEVTSGYECGFSVQSFNDLVVGDIVEAFEEIEVQKTL